MSDLDFDYGAELAESTGVKRYNPEVGPQFGVIKSIIHMGKCPVSFGNTTKAPVNKVCIVIEMKGNLLEADNDEYISGLHPETGEPLDGSVSINLNKGDNAALTKFMNAVITKKEFDAGTVKSLDQVIGRPVGFDVVGSKEKDDDGHHKYVDIKNIVAVPALIKPQVPALKNAGVGHCRLSQLTKEAVLSTHMLFDVMKGMMKSEEWKAGTHPAIALIEEIRKEQPKYATAKASDDKPTESGTGANKPATETEQVDATEEF